MQHNILRESNVTKIFLIYVDNGAKKKIAVKLRFMDNKECYFVTPTPTNFKKPKKKIQAELKVYTTDGIYQSQVTLLDSNMSLNEVLYEVSIPIKWNFSQSRLSSRKTIELPLNISFNDGFHIETKTQDLSLGGVSFILKQQISSIYKKLSGILTLELPRNTLINFPDGKLTVETKFVRENLTDNYEGTMYSFKFVGLKPEDEEILKNFLLRID